MKGIRFDGYSLALGSVLGLGAGVGLGYLLRRKAFTTKLDHEVEQIKSHYNDRLRSMLAGAGDEESEPKKSWMGVVSSALPAPVPIRPRTEGYGAGPSTSRARGRQEDQSGGGDAVSEVSGDDAPASVELVVTEEDVVRHLTTVPKDGVIYTISREESLEVDPGWQTACVTWYEEDNALVDEDDSTIPNILGTVGPLSPADFGGISEDPELKYVKNHKLQIIFEIKRDRRSFADVVLGYGNPANVKSRADTTT
jgi:hypothetical protein